MQSFRVPVWNFSSKTCAESHFLVRGLKKLSMLAITRGSLLYQPRPESTSEKSSERLISSASARRSILTGIWTNEDSLIPGHLRTELSKTPTSQSAIEPLAKKLNKQRIAPRLKHLDGVKSLYVVGVNWMTGIPVEALTDRFRSATFLRVRSSRVGRVGRTPPVHGPWPLAMRSMRRKRSRLQSPWDYSEFRVRPTYCAATPRCL